MGLTPHDLPVVLCAMCGRPITFVEQAAAVLEKEKLVHWDCWFKASNPVTKTKE